MIYSHDRYEQIVRNTIDKVIELGIKKGGEYAGDSDRLEDFRNIALAQEIPMELVWRVYAGKHWNAINTYVRDIVHERTRPRMESIDGRVDDLIVYLLLFKAMIEERTIPVEPFG